MSNENSNGQSNVSEGATEAAKTIVLVDPPTNMEECRACCYDAIMKRQALRLNRYVRDMSEMVGKKPKSADYISKDDWKADVALWEERQAIAKDIFIFAKKQDCEIADKYTVTGLASGGVNLRHTETISFKPVGFKSRF